MNWKEKGYKVGDKALIEFKYMYSKSTTEEVEVIHVGTKIIKIKRDNGNVIEFKKRSVSSDIFGLVYEIYKNKEEYDNKIKDEENRKLLIDEIRSYIGKLSLEKLELIKEIVNK